MKISAIDEEINSIIKIFEANEKKLNGMIVTYQDKKGKELESGDVEERREVIYILKATMKLFKFEYEQQTKHFQDLGSGNKYNQSSQREKPIQMDYSINGNDVTGAEIEELDRSEEGLAKLGDSMQFVEKNNFDVNLLVAEKKLQKLEKKFLNAETDLDVAVQWKLGEHSSHSYYLDTVQNIRPTWQCFWDILMIAIAYGFMMGAFNNFTKKGWMANPH